MEGVMFSSKSMLTVVFVQLALLVSVSASAQDKNDQALKARIERALRAERRDPKFAKLSLNAQMARVIARVIQTMPQDGGTQKAPVVASGLQPSEPRGPDNVLPAKPEPSPVAPAQPELLQLPPEWTVIVRKDFANIGIVNLPTPPSGATGATVSYSNDRVAKDVSWLIQGVGTVGYSFDPVGPFNYELVGVYGGINKFTNTANKPKTPSMDNVIDGALLEIGTLSQNQAGNFLNFFRFKAGSVENNIAPEKVKIGKIMYTTTQSETQFSTTGEWIPAYDLTFLPNDFRTIINGGNVTPFNIVGLPSIIQAIQIGFEPELIAQYDNTFNSANILAFSGRSSALRLGPEVGLLIFPFPNITNLSLDKLSIITFYHWYHEFEGDHTSYSFQTNLNYKIADLGGIGNLGFTIGYSRGSDENTGKKVNLFKIGLTGQLCDGPTECKAKVPTAESQ
jgi:hypothetical protein